MHQFDKVEMFVFTTAEQAAGRARADPRDRGVAAERAGIPYRVVNIAVGDLGASAAKKYDCEAWLPGQERYRELTSCSNTTDYQARRLEIRVRAAGGRPVTAATLNGTAVAVGRTIIALLENHQREDRSIALPACLVEFGAPAVIAAAVLERAFGAPARAGGAGVDTALRRGRRRKLDVNTASSGRCGADAAAVGSRRSRRRSRGRARRPPCRARGRASARQKRSKTLACVPVGQPGTVVADLDADAAVGGPASDSSIGEPAGVWVSALRIRLASTWRSCEGSPLTTCRAGRPSP